MRHHSAVSTASLCGGRSAERSATVGDVVVRGLLVDDRTRCRHYCGPLDVIALRFACCGDWYPCHLCHAEVADHDSRVWPADARATEAVVCGMCGHLLRIEEYLDADGCTACGAAFNPGCRLHHHLYFA